MPCGGRTSLPGEYVVIVGVGPIGLGVAQFAHIAGAHVIALDVSEQPLSLCPSAKSHRTLFGWQAGCAGTI